MIRYRQRAGEKWIRATQRLEPRSIYVMSGAARYDWEHSIAQQAELRYSLIFRSLASAPR